VASWFEYMFGDGCRHFLHTVHLTEAEAQAELKSRDAAQDGWTYDSREAHLRLRDDVVELDFNPEMFDAVGQDELLKSLIAKLA